MCNCAGRSWHAVFCGDLACKSGGGVKQEQSIFRHSDGVAAVCQPSSVMLALAAGVPQAA